MTASSPTAPDPLIPADFAGWLTVTGAALRRSGARLVGIVAVWSVVPLLVTGWVDDRLSYLLDTATIDTTDPNDPAAVAASLTALVDMIFYLAGTAATTVVLGYFLSAGWAAMLRVVITDAVGEPIGFGEAMRYGARHGARMWGWYALMYVCVLAGSALCVVPGVYLAVVFALFAPVVVCEGGPALARSLRLVHGSFGVVLGRVVLLFAGYVVVSLVVAIAESGTGLVPPVGVSAGIGQVIGTLVVSLVVQSLVMPVLATGLLTCYTQARRREGSLTSAAELLDRSAGSTNFA